MMKRLIGIFAFFGGLLLIWQLASSFENSNILLPPPQKVFRYIYSGIADMSIPRALFVTLKRLLAGYLIGLGLGLPLGLLTARFQYFEDTIRLLALGLQTLPSVCWVPLAILWCGQTEGAMLFVVVMGTMWSIIIATDNGVRTLPPIYIKAARTMGSKGVHLLASVVLPASLPWVIGGMKQGWAFAWRSLMAAEIYVTIFTGSGLGFLLHYGRELIAMDQVLGVMFVITGAGLLVEKMIFGPWESWVSKRWGTAK